MSDGDKGKDKMSAATPRSLLSAPPKTVREQNSRLSSTQDAMDELLDETFNSDSLEESYSLVGLEDTGEDDSSETPILAGPTSPEAHAKRYKKLKTSTEFWDELERVEEEP